MAHPDPEKRRKLWAIVAAAGVAGLVALPVAAIALGVASESSGCFITCTDSAPGTAVTLAVIGLVLAAVPVVVGISIWRSSWRAAAIGFSILAAVWALALVW
ncbi:hypothetical protein GCM10028784_32000 [Myceligenerans cantabricum]